MDSAGYRVYFWISLETERRLQSFIATCIVAARASSPYQDSGTLRRGTSSYMCQTMYMKPKGVSLITKEVVAKGVYRVGEESPLTASTCSNAQRNHSASPVAFPSRAIGPIHSVPSLSHISQVVERYRWL